jgi:hypothetical protein
LIRLARYFESAFGADEPDFAPESPDDFVSDEDVEGVEADAPSPFDSDAPPLFAGFDDE